MTDHALPELRPSDFSARLTRRAGAHGLRTGGRRRHLGQRLAVLAAAIAVPAMAAPGQWATPLSASHAPSSMPFETPGGSFPGSAFYYLADQPYAPAAARQQVPEASFALPRPALSAMGPSPMGRSLLAAGSATDHARALRCMTMAIYYEAATEPDAGQRAVAQVILNRVAHPSFPDTVCGVVFQGSERGTGCQFTFACDGSLARAPAAMWWTRAEKVAEAALSGAVYAPIGLATHYHTIQVHPYWESSLDPVGVIGNHIFYRWRGPAGQAAAFADRYLGGEPVAAPRPRLASAVAAAAPSDPLALARAYETGLPAAAAPPPATGQPAPAYSAAVEARGGDAQFRAAIAPAAGQVRDEYARAGQWIRQP